MTTDEQTANTTPAAAIPAAPEQSAPKPLAAPAKDADKDASTKPAKVATKPTAKASPATKAKKFDPKPAAKAAAKTQAKAPVKAPNVVAPKVVAKKAAPKAPKAAKAPKATKPAPKPVKAETPIKRPTSKFARHPRNPFREGSSYGLAFDILAANRKGMNRADLTKEYSRVSKKPLKNAGYDIAVLLSPKSEKPTSERHKSCREGFGVRKENAFVQIILPGKE